LLNYGYVLFGVFTVEQKMYHVLLCKQQIITTNIDVLNANVNENN